jgi:hypothetical protein
MSENPTFVEMQDEILRLRAALTDALEVMELIEDITGECMIANSSRRSSG